MATQGDKKRDRLDNLADRLHSGIQRAYQVGFWESSTDLRREVYQLMSLYNGDQPLYERRHMKQIMSSDACGSLIEFKVTRPSDRERFDIKAWAVPCRSSQASGRFIARDGNVAGHRLGPARCDGSSDFA